MPFTALKRSARLWAGALVFITNLKLANAKMVDLGTSYETYVSAINEIHQVQLLDENIASLEARLEAIGRAKQSIDLETYIMRPGRVARLVLQALAEKIKQHVRVRLLLDTYGTWRSTRQGPEKFDDAYIAQLQGAGIEVRFYNGSGLLRPGFQYRNHRKHLIIDANEVILGGRNLADEYFGLAADYNFLDRDVWVEGPIAKVVAHSFDDYWNSKVTFVPILKKSRPPKPSSPFVISLADVALRDKIKTIGTVNLARAPMHQLSTVAFASPLPDWRTHSRALPVTLMLNYIGKAKRSVLIENPYFLPQTFEKETYEKILNGHINFDLLTNSFSATDVVFVAGLSFDFSKSLIRDGLAYRAYRGTAPIEAKSFAPTGKPSRFGIHSKTLVVDGELTVIGSANLDPRSRDLNTESLFVFQRAPAFAAEVTDATQKRVEESGLVDAHGNFRGGGDISDNMSFGAHFMKILLGGPCRLVQDLF